MNAKAAAILRKPYPDFISDSGIESLLTGPEPDAARVREVIARSLELKPLGLEETAVLALASDPELVEEIFAAARALKEKIYGKRVVLFAPLYVGSLCVNDCAYCAFRRSNQSAERMTLGCSELRAQVEALEDAGHKRLIMVFGEHPRYDAEFIAGSVMTAYGVKRGNGEIRRININAAPLSHEDYAVVKDAGIGTYQIFQETYHHGAYASVHPAGTRKADYLWRLHGPTRAVESGLDDVGIGALFGLHDWKYEVLGLVAHALFLQNEVGVGPHTISFPRLRPAAGTDPSGRHPVSDNDFKRLVAILRLAVPYTGLICTAREEPSVRREALRLGVSQIDGGSRVELGGYTAGKNIKHKSREQFTLGDTRSLDEVIAELLEDGYIPSFCTACYRLGRTGEHFMEFAVPGFIRRYCTPNALATLAEYAADYAGEQSRRSAMQLIGSELEAIADPGQRQSLAARLERILRDGERDLYY